MCLARIEEKIKPTDQIRIAWKVFVIRDGAMTFPYYSAKGVWCYDDDGASGTVERGTWLKAKRRITIDEGGRYLSGFHVFVTEEAAREYARRDLQEFAARVKRCIRVRVRRVRLRGMQATFGNVLPALVADEMYIPKVKR